uniref:Sulfotransferase n=1 Tax=Plectus sambesii TaxID=2011161 RepID=A0A914X1V1_9BILA
MGSSMQAFLCYIDAPQKHSNYFFNGSWNAGLAGSACSTSTLSGDLRKRFMSGAQNIDFFSEKSGIYHLAIVRDPISRFVSAFVDVCIINTFEKEYPEKFKTLCFSCRSNMTCFLLQLHDYLYRISEHLPKERWFRDWHFYPQAWYCDFDRHIKRYHLIHYKRNDEFYKELLEFLRNIRVKSNLVNDIETKLRKKTAAHATHSKSSIYEKELLESPFLLEYVYKIYYLDFVWFDYRL